MTNATETKKFEVGKTYKNNRITLVITKRTPCFITFDYQDKLSNAPITFTKRSKFYVDESDNAEFIYCGGGTIISANSEVEKTEEVTPTIEENIAEVEAEIEQLAFNFDEDTAQFVNDNQDAFEAIKTGAKLREMDACEGYVNKRFDSIRDAYHAAFNKIGDAAAALRDNGNRKAATAITMYRNNIETLGRLHAHISIEQSTDADNTTAQVQEDSSELFTAFFSTFTGEGDDMTAEFETEEEEFATLKQAFDACLKFQAECDGLHFSGTQIEDSKHNTIYDCNCDGAIYYFVDGKKVDFDTFINHYNLQSNFRFTFDESILTPENTPDNFEDFTVSIYDDNEDMPLNADEDGLFPIFNDARDAINFAKEEYLRTGLNVTVDHLNAKMHFGEWIDLPIYSITANGEEIIYSELQEVVKAIETSKKLAAAYEGENGLANKVACTLAYSNKLTPEQTTGALYGFIREAENAGLYDFARKVRFKVLQDCWDSTFNNFSIEDYLNFPPLKEAGDS